MAHKILAGETCPRCGQDAVTFPKNYGRPQQDRRWCLECGHLWTPATVATTNTQKG